MSIYAAIGAVIIAGLTLGAFIRFSPTDPARFHLALHPRPEILGQWGAMGDAQVGALMGGGYVDMPLSAEQAQFTLARLDTIALATPRTARFAGSADAGHVTWVTRSALWGFPDYTTAQVHPQGLTVYARLRFGASDLGVNAARLRAWLGALDTGDVS